MKKWIVLFLLSLTSAAAAQSAPADSGAVPGTVSSSPRERTVLSAEYPPLLRDAGVAGKVVVVFRVGPDGRVDPGSIDILSEDNELFGAATRRALGRLRFNPATRDAAPVATAFQATFHFERISRIVVDRFGAI
jgi:TonB family protein